MTENQKQNQAKNPIDKIMEIFSNLSIHEKIHVIVKEISLLPASQRKMLASALFGEKETVNDLTLYDIMIMINAIEKARHVLRRLDRVLGTRYGYGRPEDRIMEFIARHMQSRKGVKEENEEEEEELSEEEKETLKKILKRVKI